MNLSIYWIHYLALQFYLSFLHATTLNCNYEIGAILSIDEEYKCRVTNHLNILSPNNTIIKNIIGTHNAGKSSNNNIIIHICDLNTLYFPKGMEKFFSNIIGVELTSGRLKEICEDDLRELTKLKSLNLAQNDIEILEDNLFSHNPHLISISFYNNRIFYVGQSALNIVRNLSYLFFTHNKCYSVEISKSQREVKNAIAKISQNCKNRDFIYITANLTILKAQLNALTLDSYLNFQNNLKNVRNYFEKSTISNSFILNRKINELSDLKEHTSKIIENELQMMREKMTNNVTNACSEDNVAENWSVNMFSGLCAVIIVQSIFIVCLCIGCLCRRKKSRRKTKIVRDSKNGGGKYDEDELFY